jgi:divalent metal cation (Fe/Co/Zn/Cd) transporter
VSSSTEGVTGLHDLKTRKMGDLALVDVHLEVNGELSVKKDIRLPSMPEIT